MNKQPKVSVIIPVYNVEQFLPQCLDSILAQTLKDIEIICVNDGSPDNSQAILEEYAAKDPRIVIEVKENGGLSSARNHGMKVARGEYIGFVDSDDFVEEEMFAKLYKRAEQTDADIVVGNLYLYDHQTGKTAEHRDLQLYLFLKNKVFRAEDYPEFVRSIAAWDRIYKRSFLEEIGAQFPHGLVYEDAPFTMETITQAERIAVVPDMLYYYRKNAGGSITDREARNERYKRDFLEVNRRTMEFFSGREISDELRREYLTYFMLNAVMHQKNAVMYTMAREFFDGVRALLSEKDYELIGDMDFRPVRVYCQCLREGNYRRAHWYFWLRGHFRREGGHIYARLFKGGREFRIR